MTHRRVAEWAAAHPFLTNLLVLVAVVSPGYFVMQDLRSHDREIIDCVTEWADASTGRSETLTQLNQNRTSSLDLLVRAIAMSDRQLFRDRLTDYIEASDEYERALAQNPVPESPKIECNSPAN